MQDQRCENCVFYLASANSVSDCRRRPVYVPRRIDDWCGEWKPANTATGGWIVSLGVPVEAIGENGDLCVDAMTGDVYQKINGTWS